MSPEGCPAHGVTLRADFLAGRFVLLCREKRQGLEKARGMTQRGEEKTNLDNIRALAALFLGALAPPFFLGAPVPFFLGAPVPFFLVALVPFFVWIHK